MFNFLLAVQAVVAAAMIGVILMQKSEGGGLGTGGSPSGLLSARSASDFLTRTTAILATLFVALSIALGGLAATRHGGGKLDDSLTASKRAATAPATSTTPALPGATLPGTAPATGAPATTPPITGPALPGTAPADNPLAPGAQQPAQPAQPAGVPIEQ